MQLYGAMDCVAHTLNFSSRWCQLHTKARLPLGEGPPPIIHWMDRPEDWSGCGEQRNPFPLQ